AAKAAMIRARFPQLRERARALGMEIAAEPPRLGVDTRAAHEAAKFVAARAPEQVRPYHQAAFRAHFVDGRDLADRAVPGELGARLGLPADALAEALADGRHRDAVLADEEEARGHGFHAVPQLVMEGH